MASYIPTGFLSVLIGDTGTNDATPTPTKVGSNNSSSILELKSTTRALTLPRMTTAQINAIANPLDGMLAYSTDDVDLFVRKGGAWIQSEPLEGISFDSVTLTAADVQGMFANGFEIIEAPGAGLATIVHSFAINYIRAGASFANGGNIYLEYGGAGAGPAITGNITAATLLAGANSNGLASGAFSNVAATNQAVGITNATGAFTAGGTSTVVVQVWYSTVESS